MLSRLDSANLLLQSSALVVLLISGLELFYHPLLVVGIWLYWSAAIGYGILVDWRALQQSSKPSQWMRENALTIGVLLFSPLLILLHVGWAALLVFRQLATIIRLASRWQPIQRQIKRLMEQPAQLITWSFILLIGLGTILLRFPAASATHQPITWNQALFTATSASCVTGLVVLDTPTAFSGFGQIVILLLIQIGGLGIMTLSSFIIWLLGRRLDMKSQSALGEVLDEPTPARVLHLLRTIFLATLLIEMLGAFVLFLRWYTPTQGLGYSAYISIFHAISAFCNAGFALWSNSLILHQRDIVVNLTMIILICMGGFGFPIFASLVRPGQRRHLKKRTKEHSLWLRCLIYMRMLPLNTKIILWVHPLLFLIGFLLFLPLEWNHSLGHLSTGHKLLAGMFQSVTLRTAGFNTVDFALLTQGTLLIMILFMFVGGCSGGTAGGIKVNTIVVLFLSLRATIRGRNQVEAFGRALPQQTITRATVIVFSFLAIFFVSFFALLVTHPNVPFSHLMFEVTSALGTVGLTTATKDGIATTSKLDSFGQMTIIFLMFIGRIGPLTLALAISEKPKPGHYQYPQERIYVG